MHPRTLLRGEAVAVAAVAVAGLYLVETPWWVVAVLALAPDLGMLGYYRNARFGALTYNLCHWYPFPVALGVMGVVWGVDPAVWAALVWIAHIAVDRAVGYGLKHADAFDHTHLSHTDTTTSDPDRSVRTP